VEQPASAQIARVIVMKFGGSSVADAEKIRNVARRLVAAHETGRPVVGVVSAMGKTTDGLVSLAGEVSMRPHPREMDMLLSTGERISAALCAMAIEDLGHRAVSLTGSQAGIVTDTTHTNAKIVDIRPKRIREALGDGRIVLVAGFQGVSTAYDVTTLGRGASDLTAVALAGALDGDCEIYSDVEGVFTADPRIVPEARKLSRVSPLEMLEMAGSGARVLQLRSVEFARNHDVPIHVRSTFSDAEGTWIREDPNMEDAIISGITHNVDEAYVTLTDVPDKPGTAASIFNAVATAHINVDTIIQNAVTHGDADITFSIPRDELPLMTDTIEGLCRDLGLHWRVDDEAGKVSLIGAGMKSHPGIAARMFQTLAEHGINVRMIATSPIKVSCVIAREKVPDAVKALHAAFADELELARGGAAHV
jgi:aspartate kinase